MLISPKPDASHLVTPLFAVLKLYVAVRCTRLCPTLVYALLLFATARCLRPSSFPAYFDHDLKLNSTPERSLSFVYAEQLRFACIPPRYTSKSLICLIPCLLRPLALPAVFPPFACKADSMSAWQILGIICKSWLYLDQLQKYRRY